MWPKVLGTKDGIDSFVLLQSHQTKKNKKKNVRTMEKINKKLITFSLIDVYNDLKEKLLLR